MIGVSQASEAKVIPAPGPEKEEPTNKKYVYDYVDANNIWLILLLNFIISS